MTRRLLVTGAAGFIGANFCHYWHARHPGDRLVAYDALTYAGNRANLRALEGADTFRFVHADIADTACVAGLLREEAIDTLVHFAQETLPFGGVGASGLGAYHGRAGFETFSHARSVLVASRLSPARRLLAPPLGLFIEKALEVLVRGASAVQRR